jgi:hypothetical protein
MILLQAFDENMKYFIFSNLNLKQHPLNLGILICFTLKAIVRVGWWWCGTRRERRKKKENSYGVEGV